MKATVTARGVDELDPVSSDGNPDIAACEPYVVRFKLKGVADLLFHRWSCEAVAEKAASAKGSKAKKSDNVESYVYRCEDGTLGIPGEYVRMAMVGAARFQQDPRSPRKSAMDLYKAAVIPLTVLASTGLKEWDYLSQKRVQVQRNGVTRVRPAIRAGYEVEFDFQVNLPEYVSDSAFHGVLANAGRLIGLGDFRPTYGRFAIVAFERVT